MGNSLQSRVENINMTDCITDKHLPQSRFTGQFFYMTTFSFGVYLVNQSMLYGNHHAPFARQADESAAEFFALPKEFRKEAKLFLSGILVTHIRFRQLFQFFSCLDSGTYILSFFATSKFCINKLR
jgi:hypothetical protein